jgi:hypothetical protein
MISYAISYEPEPHISGYIRVSECTFSGKDIAGIQLTPEQATGLYKELRQLHLQKLLPKIKPNEKQP